MNHSCFGLRVWANRSIPRLPPTATTARVDLEVWLGPTPPELANLREQAQPPWYCSLYTNERGQPYLTAWKLNGGDFYQLSSADGADFFVDQSGSRIWAKWPETLTVEDVSSYLLGPIMGFALRLRGFTCLHASAISVRGQAVAFIGPAGAGKSTLAAAFARRGHPVLSDDIVPLLMVDGAVMAQPSYPRLRLSSQSVKALSALVSSLPEIIHKLEDRRLHLDLTQNGYRFESSPLPLAAIYLLEARDAHPASPCVEPLAGVNPLMTLIGHSYASSLVEKENRGKEFEFLGRVVAQVPLRRVHPHADPARLSRLCDAILDDLERTVLASS